MNNIAIPSDKYFYVCDGTVIRNLGELPGALRNMDPESFEHHVNEEKNDFYSWVGEVFEHSRLARNIKNIKSKELMAKKVFIEMFT